MCGMVSAGEGRRLQCFRQHDTALRVVHDVIDFRICVSVSPLTSPGVLL